MDRTVHAAAPKQGSVGRVDYGIDIERGDIAPE